MGHVDVYDIVIHYCGHISLTGCFFRVATVLLMWTLSSASVCIYIYTYTSTATVIFVIYTHMSEFVTTSITISTCMHSADVRFSSWKDYQLAPSFAHVKMWSSCQIYYILGRHIRCSYYLWICKKPIYLHPAPGLFFFRLFLIVIAYNIIHHLGCRVLAQVGGSGLNRVSC